MARDAAERFSATTRSAHAWPMQGATPRCAGRAVLSAAEPLAAAGDGFAHRGAVRGTPPGRSDSPPRSLGSHVTSAADLRSPRADGATGDASLGPAVAARGELRLDGAIRRGAHAPRVAGAASRSPRRGAAPGNARHCASPRCFDRAIPDAFTWPGSQLMRRPPRRRRQTIQRASATMPPDILDWPTRRSSKTIGTSTMRRPARWTRYFISIWKP